MKVNQTIVGKLSAKKSSKGATILYVILASLHFLLTLFGCLTFLSYANKTGKYWTVFLAPSVAISYYYIVRELIYKMFHMSGYHAQEHLKSFGSGGRKISFPVFEKHTDNYRIYYQKRSKRHQFLYFISFLIYRNILLFVVMINALLFFYLFSEKLVNFNKIGIFFSLVIVVIQCFILEMFFERYKKWFIEQNRVKIILIERGFPIFMQDDSEIERDKK